MSDRREFMDALADHVLDVAAEIPAEALAVLGRALQLGGGRLAGIGSTLWIWTLDADFPAERWLERMRVTVELDRLARDDELFERLKDAEEPLWVALREALVQVRAWAAGDPADSTPTPVPIRP
jgi:hypothetical protein